MITTERLTLRPCTLDDAQYIEQLFNQPECIRYIGDKNIKSKTDAKQYIKDNFILSYQQNGFGLYAIELSDSAKFIGLCGLVKRDGIGTPDLGFALISEFAGQGFAMEASSAVIAHTKKQLPLSQIYAFTDRDNKRSIALLTKLGFIPLARELMSERFKDASGYELAL